MKTPKYVFDAHEIKRCYNLMQQKLRNIRIYYSLKANSAIEVLSILKDCGSCFEVASEGEFNKLLSLKVPIDRIICGLPVKPIDWLKNMYDNGCRYFVYDMLSELEKIRQFAPLSKKVLRININDLIPDSIEFGMSISDIVMYISETNLADDIDGLSFHISNNIDVNNLHMIFRRVTDLLERLPLKPLILNIGGGYRSYASDEFFSVLCHEVDVISNRFQLDVIAEPGNTLVNSSGKVQTSVIGVRKRSNSEYDVYIDAGKPSGIKTDEKRIPSYIKLLNDTDCCEPRKYRFVDITCMHKPHFYTVMSQKIKEGDILEFGDMGAYTLCLSSNFHVWDPPNVEVV